MNTANATPIIDEKTSAVGRRMGEIERAAKTRVDVGWPTSDFFGKDRSDERPGMMLSILLGNADYQKLAAQYCKLTGATEVTVDCDNGKGAEVPVPVYVIDQEGDVDGIYKSDLGESTAVLIGRAATRSGMTFAEYLREAAHSYLAGAAKDCPEIIFGRDCEVRS